jgi:DNA polymerase-3 subunit epsilon
MNPWNERVHGISSSKLVKAKTFDELWTELKPWLDDQIIVAHNASFDTRILRASLAYYELALPSLTYFCSVNLSKKVWTQLAHYTLDSVCNYHGIRFHHHRAGDDAEACARISLLAFGEVGASTVDEGLIKLGLKLKVF